MDIKEEPVDSVSDTETDKSITRHNHTGHHLDVKSNHVEINFDRQNGVDSRVKIEVDMKSDEIVKTEFDNNWSNSKKHFYDDETMNLYRTKNFEISGCSSTRKNRHIKMSPVRTKKVSKVMKSGLDLTNYCNINKELQITLVTNTGKTEIFHKTPRNTPEEINKHTSELNNYKNRISSTAEDTKNDGVLLTGLSEAFYEENNEDSLNTWMNHKFVTDEGLFSYNNNEFNADRVYKKSDFFACGLCEFTCKTPAQLKSHDIIHTQPFVCDECPSFKFRYLSHLKQHQLIHNNIKPFSCDLCAFKCKRTSELRTHKIIHSDVKPYVCEFCQFRCKRLNELKKHKMIHSSEKPFSCNVCDFKCRQSCHLRRHKMIHNGEKPFVCHLCDFKCRTSSNLKTHSFIHNNLKPFVCNVCQFRCRTSGNLKKHQTIHRNLPPITADSK